MIPLYLASGFWQVVGPVIMFILAMLIGYVLGRLDRRRRLRKWVA